ncbi:MAG: hypothetical protein LUB83_05080 [Prevotellaceae bacterium]|nr:hypothetical protein [Prevotellaceae bacterium]
MNPARHSLLWILALLLSLLIGKEQAYAQGVDLSLWKGIATQRTDTVGGTSLNIGLLSAMNRLNGFGVNVLGAVVGKEMNGVQLSGLANVVNGDVNGFQIAGITNVNGRDVAGISLSGLVGIASNDVRGVMASGWVNVTGSDNYGVLASGLVNIAGSQSTGLELAGLANVGASHVEGVQLAGLLNVAAGSMKGVQLSGLGNVASQNTDGVQLAPCNILVRGRGLQIGLVNYYREQLDGFQLGLVNANPHTRVQLMLYGGNSTKLNMAVRFKNKVYYTILGIGAPYLDFSDKFSTAFFYRAGAELPLCKRLFLSGDLGYGHIALFKNKRQSYPPRLYALQTRLNLEYRPTDILGIFLTGGYGWDRRYKHHAGYDNGVIYEAGLVLF